MIKSELVQRIAAQNPHLYQRDVENIVNAILGEIIAALSRGDRVELRGFGAFSVKHRPARTGRNPRTGAHVAVLVGGIAAWLGQRKSRRAARRLEAELREARAETEAWKRRAEAEQAAATPLTPLTYRPPPAA